MTTIKVKKCCICGQEMISNIFGNNPWPLSDKGRCCDYCNLKKVIPARVKLLNLKHK